MFTYSSGRSISAFSGRGTGGAQLYPRRARAQKLCLKHHDDDGSGKDAPALTINLQSIWQIIWSNGKRFFENMPRLCGRLPFPVIEDVCRTKEGKAICWMARLDSTRLSHPPPQAVGSHSCQRPGRGTHKDCFWLTLLGQEHRPVTRLIRRYALRLMLD
jgi:hypothetical protein